jgi:hypothetical protein
MFNRIAVLPHKVLASTAVVLASAMAACSEHPNAPVPSEALQLEAQTTAVASGRNARSRTLNGCRYTYYYGTDANPTVDAIGGVLPLEVEGPAGSCRFRAVVSSGGTWLSAPTAWMRGVATIRATASRNTSSSTRTANVRIDAETPRGIVTFVNIRVTQAPGAPKPPDVCRFDLESALLELTPAGGSRSLQIRASSPLCEMPRLNSGVIYGVLEEAGRRPGAITATVTARDGAFWLDLGVPANATSSVRAAGFRLVRSGYSRDSAARILVVQRGSLTAATVAVPSNLTVSGESQLVVVPATAPALVCWLWMPSYIDGQNWFSNANGYYSECGSKSIVLRVNSNGSGNLRSGIVWVLDQNYSSIRNYAVLQQAPLP